MRVRDAEVRLADADGRPLPAEDAIISVRGLTKVFGDHVVLDGIDLDIPRGKITAIMGPSGTGKSVLLKHIVGLLTPDAGQIWVDGEPIVGISPRRLYQIRRKFGVLFQDGALFGSLDLYDNIAFPLREHTRKTEKEIRRIVHHYAELVGLTAHLRKLPSEISGGMRKRAGLARALVLEPEIILFDEPDSGLDPVRVAYLDDLILRAQKESKATFFIITHNVASVMRTADYVGVLFRSRLIHFGTKDATRQTTDVLVRQFLEGSTSGPIQMDEMAEANGTLEEGEQSDSEPPSKASPVSEDVRLDPRRLAPAGLSEAKARARLGVSNAAAGPYP
jgi:phospholipid/cholesterol/gamma-HCH transport system ATP-binding protein